MKGTKSKPWVLLGVALLMRTIIFAQSIHFNYTDGTNASYNLEDVRKITFDADVMNLHLLDGSLYAWNVSTIGHYEYDETSVNVQDWLNNANTWEVNVYPNPTSTSLNVRFNLPQAEEISIVLVDMQGKLMLEKKLGYKTSGEHQETLDLKDLTQGSYVCRITGKQNSITKQVVKK
jgi:hypothetical protein